MQLFNKSAIKKTFVHTWYIYPLLAGLVTVIWLWAFYAYHQPTKHQTLSLFFSAKVKSLKFVDQIQKKYSEENLREVSVSGLLPEAKGYYDKLEIAFNECDLLILDKVTISEYEGHYDLVFYRITDEVIENYVEGEHEYYTFTDSEENTYKYGIKVDKERLSNYMDFHELRDYYICVCKSSVNCGSLKNKSNAKYDNALTFMNYLLEL